MTIPFLLPAPRQLVIHHGELALSDRKLIVLNCSDPQRLCPVATRLRAVLAQQAGVRWQLGAGYALPEDRIGVLLTVNPHAAIHEQGYDLEINTDRISITARSAVGVYYGCLTLIQLAEQHRRALPHLRISDWPDFPHRGVMLDISRDKVPTMETLFGLIDLLASWKINQLQLYTEHTFAYQNHPTVWADASPMTGEEILALDAFCRERFIELVPNQNTFGHMYRWLRHDEYIHLAEITEGAQTPWGTYWEGPYSLSPAHPGSIGLVRDMLDELLPHFSSRQVNVGCDETFDLGKGQSEKMVEEQGVGRVYLDFVNQIHREVQARGHTMQFWGDIIMEHPELTPELPGDAIALEWGYEADHPFDAHCARFAASGIPFYVCPGTSSWRTVAGRTDNAIGNLRNAAENGLKHGAIGYLVTDWGDEGHWQPLPVSYLGFLYGAALSWNVEANTDLDLPAALDQFVFRDHAGEMGRLVYELGNVYQEPGIFFPNSSVLFHALQSSPDQIRNDILGGAPNAVLERIYTTLDRIGAAIADLDATDLQIPDAELVRREFLWVCDMLRHACHRILWVQTRADGDALHAGTVRLIEQFESIWHERNRPGGFQNSVARMHTMQEFHPLGNPER